MKLLLLTLTLLLSSKGEESPEEINYYVKLISEAYKNASTYQWPTSATEYESSQKRKLFGSYDFVIIGGGAAGSVIARRLTEVPSWSVLVLEAGHHGNNLSDIPNMYTPIDFTDFNWAYNSTPQSTACLGLVNRICPYPRGKGVGGSSLINGLLYVRGHRKDFDQWAKLVGNRRWGYDSVLQYFKKSENFVHNDPRAPYEAEYHEKGGLLRVEYHKPRSPQLNAFLEANKELGYNIVDYNANKLGVSPSQLNTYHGQRWDDGRGFLSIKRRNLKILTESYVTRIRFYKGVASGVEFSHKGGNFLVEARKEVILSAGVFGSPQILMLSGIGPKQHLEDLKIDLISDLGVGTTLRDNSAFYGINVGTNYTEPIKPLSYYVKEYLNGTGSLAIPNNLQGLGFYESSYTKGTGVPEIELVMVPANATNELTQRKYSLSDETYEVLWKNINRAQTFLVFVTVLHAESIGTVRLKTKNPYEYPLINSNFISDPKGKDINTIYEGILLVLKLPQTKPFKALDVKLQGGPLKACEQYQYLSKDYWYCAIRQVTINLYHPLGTCPMGVDPKKGAVVDSELKIFGVKNLRVADASVFPLIPAGHSHAPTVMVAEQVSDIIKEQYQMY